MPRRYPVLVAILALVLVLGTAFTTGFGLSVPHEAARAQPEHPDQMHQKMGRHPLPPELEFLRSLPADEQFDHMLGVQARVAGPDGQEISVFAIPGRVTSVGENAVSVDPNGAPEARTFNVTQDTWVLTGPQKGRLNAFAQNDPVVVITVDDSANAWAIVAPSLTTMPMMMRDGAMGEESPATPAPAD